MENRTSFAGTFLLIGFAAFMFLPLQPSFSDPAGSNCWHLNSPLQAESNADLVCKVRVLKLQRDTTFKGSPASPDQIILRMIAKAEVISVVKGQCPDKIDIEFHYPKDVSKFVSTVRRKYPRVADFAFPYSKGTNGGLSPLSWDFYARLSKGEVALVFLKQSDDHYKLGPITSKARVEPKKVPYNLGQTPNLKLLAEFLAGCESDNEMVKLQAVEELGYLGLAMIEDLRPAKSDNELFQKIASGLTAAKHALAKVRSSKNPVISSASFISSFQVDDSPGIEGPLRLLRTDQALFDPNDSAKKYGIRSFSIPALQLRLLETMDATTRRAVIDLKDGSVIRPPDGRPGIYRGVRNFDYAGFYRLALDCPAVKNSPEMRSAIANVIWIRCEKSSVPEMARLLDDSNTYARFVAVGALMNYTGQGPERRGWEEFEKDDRQYIEYWKNWWQQNKDNFAPLQAP